MSKLLVNQKISRRSIIKLAGASAIGASAFGQVGCSRTLPVPPSRFSEADPQIFSEDERQFLAALQNHLLPSEWDSPGARDVHATEYLELALTGSDIDPSHKGKIKTGIVELEKLSNESEHKSFDLLSDSQREAVLRKFEDEEKGYDFLRLVMTYTIEAYLGDPAYGGNTEELGWRAMGHHPGVPRPVLINSKNRR